MPRTTVDIDAPVLRDLKVLQKREGKSLGRLISDLLAEALGRYGRRARPRALRWRTQAMDARVDLEDKDALYRALDAEDGAA